MAKPPSELKVRIGSPAEAMWRDVRDEARSLLEQSRRNQVIQEAIMLLAEQKMGLERENFLKESS